MNIIVYTVAIVIYETNSYLKEVQVIIENQEK